MTILDSLLFNMPGCHYNVDKQRNHLYHMDKGNVKSLFQSKFIKVYDLQYEEGKHYYDASRREADSLAAVKSEDEWKDMIPDAVSCFVILRVNGKEYLLLSYEYRYPAGQYLLSVPAGLIDPGDSNETNPVLAAAKRELHEETNIVVKDTDRLEIINPLVFSTPGMTDESNALVLAFITLNDLSGINQNGAEGSEKFDGYVLLTKADAGRILKNGVDDHGHYYPLYTWAALMYFISDLWKNEQSYAGR